jgi:tetratricopeptide (TPR) repeat protein/transcriptional regulator with XRE-family HTH domain
MEKSTKPRKPNDLLQHEREKRGLSQKRLAELVGADPSMISRWERGVRGTEPFYQEKLCAFFEKDAVELGFLAAQEIIPMAPSSVNAGLSYKEQLYHPPFDETLLTTPEHFIGREEDLQWLKTSLLAGGTTSISALGGMGGIGKTALAAVTIRKMRAEGYFQDGIAVQLCQDMVDANELAQKVLARFDSQRRQPETHDISELIDFSHRLLDGKDALIVLDNIEPGLDIEWVLKPLRAASVTVLLTARHSFPSSIVPPERCHILDLLSLQEAMDLFAQSIGKQTVQDLNPTECSAVENIVKALGRHTLAVKLTGAYAFDCKRSLRKLVKELEDPQQVLELPDGEVPRAVALSFARSTDRLLFDAQRLYVALASFPTAGFGRRAALALGTALHLTSPKETVELLIRRALIEPTENDMQSDESDYERLRLHPLMRVFAVQMFSRWSDDERNAAQLAVATYYAHYVEGMPHTALGIDESNISGALEWVHLQGKFELVARLCLGMHIFWRDRARTVEALQYLPWGIAAAEAMSKEADRREDRLRAAHLTITYGQILRDVGELEEAESRLLQTLDIYHREQYLHGKGEVLTFLGQITKDRGQLDKARDFFEQSLAIHRETQNLRGQSWNLSYLGRIAHYREQLKDAESYYQSSIAIHRQLQDRRSEAWILGWLGQIALFRGHVADAERYYQNALAIHHQNQDRRGEAAIPHLLGRIAEIRGQVEEAKFRYEESIAICREIKDLRGFGWRICDLGRVVQIRNLLEEAASYYNEGLTLLRQVYDRQGQGEALICLGRLKIACKELDKGSHLLQQALTINREVEYKSGECIALSLLGEIALERCQYDIANELFQQSLAIVQKGENRLLQGRILFLCRNCAEACGDIDRAKSFSFEVSTILSEVNSFYVTNSLLSYSP